MGECSAMTPKVSVIIPFYSRADWLDEAIESVINQTHKVDEIIVVDDGSPENVDFVFRKYQNRVFLIKQNNGGAAKARNVGISHSTGDVIFFLDSDDIWCADKVEKQLTFMTSNNFRWSATYYSTFGADEIKVVKQKTYLGLCWKKLYDTCSIQTSTVAVFRDALRGMNFDEGMKNGQDVYLWFKLANHYPLGVVKEPLSRFRIRGNNAHLSLETHIRVRALLWNHMVEGNLFQTNRPLTKLGYKMCHRLFEKNNKSGKQNGSKISVFTKMAFALSWLLFRFDELIQRK